jgi:hypothetical protein
LIVLGLNNGRSAYSIHQELVKLGFGDPCYAEQSVDLHHKLFGMMTHVRKLKTGYIIGGVF